MGDEIEYVQKKPKCKNKWRLQTIVLVTFRPQELQRTLRNVTQKCLNLNLQHTSKSQHKSLQLICSETCLV